MFKRIFFFLAMNLAVLLTVSIVLNVLGVQPYLTAYGLNYESLMIFCLIWGMVGSFFSLAISKFMAKKFMGVQIVDGDPRYQELVNTVHQYAKAANLPKMPEVGIYQAPDVNAFATGPSKSNSLVAVSTGLLGSMNKDEVDGVLAHEVAHIANGDMVTMALIQGVVNAFVMFFARIAAFAVQNALRSDDDEGGAVGGLSYMITTIIFDMIFGFIGMFIVAYFSRAREFRADEGGAKLAGRNKMVAALKRLQSEFSHFDQQEPQMAAGNTYSKNMNAMKISSKDGLFALLSTHPSLDKRISKLEFGK